MIMVEDGISNPMQNEALASMFEARKRVFVDLLKWNVPVIDGRFELDQYDDEHALYVIVSDGDGDHLGSARLLPTTRPHILGDHYPQLCASAVPRGPSTFEITRFCLGRNQGADARRTVRNQLVSALVEVALERGITLYTGVAELRWLQQILAFGWECRPLGHPQQSESGLLGALSIIIDDETPALLARNGIWSPETCEMAYAA